MDKKEREIVDEILSGRKVDFEFIVDKYQQMVFTVALGFLQNIEDAQDVTQEVFIAVYLGLRKFRGDCLLSTWIYQIAVNKSLEFLRKNKKERKKTSLGEDERTVKMSYDKDETFKSLVTKETLDLFSKALENIPVKQRTAFILSKYKDLSQKEIAMVMKIGEKAVESLLQRAKKSLKKHLSKAMEN